MFGNEEKHEISTEEIAGQRWVESATYRNMNFSVMERSEKFRRCGFAGDLPVELLKRVKLGNESVLKTV